MGLPEMDVLWKDLSKRKQESLLDKNEEKFFKKLVKTLHHLSQDPRHNSLVSHEIEALGAKF